MKPGCSTLPWSPAWCCLLLSSNSHLIAGVQQRSSLSCTEQIKNTFSSYSGKKMLMKRRSLLFRDLSLILSCFTLQPGVGRSPGVRVGQETVSSWAFRWVKGYHYCFSQWKRCSCGAVVHGLHPQIPHPIIHLCMRGRKWHMLQLSWSFNKQKWVAERS